MRRKSRNSQKPRYFCVNFLKVLIFTGIIFCVKVSCAQNKKVDGIVTNPLNVPLSGVILKEKDGDLATVTDLKGRFVFHISKQKGSLVVSKPGFVTKVVEIRQGQELTIILVEQKKGVFQEKSDILDFEFSAWGKDNLSSAVVVQETDHFHRSAATTAELFQLIPGITCRKDNGSVLSDYNLWVNGIESGNSGQPLLIIDGVVSNSGINSPEPLYNFSPLVGTVKDIKEVTVLKDAASTAIYGSRGANGVILITTREGFEDSLRFQYHGQVGADFPISGTTPMELGAYRGLMDESFMHAGFGESGIPDDAANRDWYGDMYSTGINSDHVLSLSGKSRTTQYYLSGNVNLSRGILEKTALNSGAARFNLRKDLFKWLLFKTNLKYAEAASRTPVHYKNNIGGEAINYTSYFPPVNTGDITAGYAYGGNSNLTDPEKLLAWQRNENNSSLMSGNFSMEIKPVKNFIISSRGSGDYSDIDESYNQIFTGLQSQLPGDGLKQDRKSTVYNWRINNFMKYERLSGKSHWMILIGSEEYFMKVSSNIIGEYNPINKDEVVTFAFSGKNSRRVSALYSQMQYALDKRFDVSLTVRREGVLNQGGANLYGIFPAFSAGYMIKRNRTAKGIFNGLKIKAGWGKPGANRFYSMYYVPEITGFNSGIAYLNDSFGALTVTDPNTRWEDVEELNVGFVSEWLNNNLTLEVNYTDRLFENVLLSGTYPEGNENSTEARFNFGRTHSSGFEVRVDYRKEWDDIGVFSTLNMKHYRNKVLDLGEGSNNPFLLNCIQGTNTPVTVNKAGEVRNAFYGYIMDGIFQDESEIAEVNAADQNPGTFYQSEETAPGDIKFRDLDGNGRIDESDRTVTGSPYPAILFSAVAGVVHKKFDFAVYFDASTGGELLNLNKMYAEASGGWFNRSAVMEERWNSDLPSVDLPRVHLFDPNRNSRIHSGMVEDADFFSIKKIEFGYIVNKGKKRESRLYLSCTNVLMLSGYSGNYPIGGNYDSIYGIDFGTVAFASTVMLGIQFGI